MNPSPYYKLPRERWLDRTKELVGAHPLSGKEIVEVTIQAWDDIFKSKIGRKPFHIGKEILPKPQIMGFLLHELIPLEFSERYKGIWRAEKSAKDKDLIYIPDVKYSVEIKTSSSSGKIFGNRSYAQVTESGKKDKSGYYLAVNFQKFGPEEAPPKLSSIRFGWLDHSDWMGQEAASGQQARLSPDVENFKLLSLYKLK